MTFDQWYEKVGAGLTWSLKQKELCRTSFEAGRAEQRERDAAVVGAMRVNLHAELSAAEGEYLEDSRVVLAKAKVIAAIRSATD